MKASKYNIWADVGAAHYVFNGVSGALVRVANDERPAVDRFLEGDDDCGCSPGVLEQLTRGRMLVADDADEVETLRIRYQMSRYNPRHLGFTIVTSLGCNFDCPYCFEDKHPSILGDDVQAALLALVDDSMPNIRDLSVTWFGGEPLLGKRPLISLSDAFIERCDRAGVEYSAGIVTNGWLLDDKTCRELAERRVTTCQVTIDGPPDVHDVMRPLVGGKPSFWRIVENLHHAVEHLDVTVRVNVAGVNFPRVEELLAILRDEGLAGKIVVTAGQLTDTPGAAYEGRCFSNREFAGATAEFDRLANQYGMGVGVTLPAPTGVPCTAVAANELVIGSDGELYKCWDDVGNPRQVIGDIRDYMHPNGRLARWLKYDPFSNAECRGCVALPVCMGGCAHHGMDIRQYENRCGTFRHTYAETVQTAAAAVERAGTNPWSTPVKLVRRTETR